MEARLIRKHKLTLVFNAFFLLSVLGANSLAQSMGWTPASEMVRVVRVRVSRAGRRLRKIFDN